jgi:hypothetical protein
MMGGGILSDIGHGLMNVARSGTSLFKKIRGDKDDVIVEGPAPVNYANLAAYGTLAAIALLVVVKKK